MRILEIGVIGVPLIAGVVLCWYLAQQQIEISEDRRQRHAAACATFQENKQIWIDDGQPGGYEALRSMLDIDADCQGSAMPAE